MVRCAASGGSSVLMPAVYSSQWVSFQPSQAATRSSMYSRMVSMSLCTQITVTSTADGFDALVQAEQTQDDDEDDDGPVGALVPVT